MVRRTPSRGALPPDRLPKWLALVAILLLALTAGDAFAGLAPHAVPTLAPGLVTDSTIDRTTPRRALTSFLDAARAGDFSAAAHCFDLRSHVDGPAAPELAEELSYVLYRRAPIDLNTVSDDPNAHDGQVTVDTFVVGEQEVPLILARVKFDDGIQRWVFSRSTVRHIPDLAATVRTAVWQQKLPHALRGPVVFGNAPWQWVGIIGGLLLAYTLGRALAAIFVRIGASFARRTTLFEGLTIEAARRPLRTILASSIFALIVYALGVSLIVSRVLDHLAYTAFIVGFAWMLLAAFNTVAAAFSPKEVGNEPPRDQAAERTRRALLQRLASAAIIGVTVAILLLQFDVVRHVGLSLLASAGILGVVVGLAAQKSLAGVIAGIQLSITQPIRLGDTIFFEGEIGVVQDIFLTYAVIRLFDGRCIVAPLAKFLDSPFQNWTLLTHDVNGVVLLHVKFTAPLTPIRARVREICEAHPKWDSQRCEVQVGDSDMYGMILRITVSARNPTDAWELRCAVREGVIELLTVTEGGVHLG